MSEVKVHNVAEAFSEDEQNSAKVYATKEARTNEEKDEILMVDSPLNGEQPLFAKLGYYDLRTLVGRLLTIIDASYPDSQQRKAVKDLVKQEIWFHWANNLDRPNRIPVGIPGDQDEA